MLLDEGLLQDLIREMTCELVEGSLNRLLGCFTELSDIMSLSYLLGYCEHFVPTNRDN